MSMAEAQEVQEELVKREYSFVRLSPIEIGQCWTVIRHSSVESSPGGVSEESLTNILKGLQDGRISAWVVTSVKEIVAVGTSTVIEDNASKVKSLLVYSIFSYEFVDVELWKTLFIALKKYAKSCGCKTIVAFAENKRVLGLLKEFGAKFDMRATISVED